MTFQALRKKEGHITGLIALEQKMSARDRSWAKRFIFLAAPFLVIALFSFGIQLVIIPLDIVFGVFLLLTAFWLTLFMLDCFYYSHYFKGSRFSIHEWGIDFEKETVPFQILEIVSHTHSVDLTPGFLVSRAGKDICARLNLTKAEVNIFISGPRQKVYADSVNFGDKVTLTSYSTTVYDADKSFSAFLAGKGIKREDFVGTASWVSYIYQWQKDAFRWWGRDSLGRIKGIGKEWAVKDVNLLKQYGAFIVPQEEDFIFKREIDELERILARNTYANALVVAEDTSEFLAIVSGLAERINDGSALTQIVHKRLLLLDIAAIDKARESTEEFKNLIVDLLKQATKAGHIILVIKDLPFFIFSFKKRDLDMIQILGPFLASPEIQIVAFALSDIFKGVLQKESALTSRFEKIFIEKDNQTVIIRALENKIFEAERRTGLFFTYQSLVRIVELANQKISAEADVEDRAFKILAELLPGLVKKVLKEGRKEITAKDVVISSGEKG